MLALTEKLAHFTVNYLRLDALRGFGAALGISAALMLPASAGTVTRLLDHGPGDAAPTDYGVYQGKLFYTDAGKLWRIDGIAGDPQQVSLPAPFDGADLLTSSFAVFDGSLFMNLQLSSSLDYRRSYQDAALLRLDNPGGQPVIVQVSAVPGVAPPGHPRPVISVGWPRPGPLVVQNGKLYFTGYAGYKDEYGEDLLSTYCDSVYALQTLFEIESSGSDATTVIHPFNYCLMTTEPGVVPIVASEFGLLVATVQTNVHVSFRDEYIYLDSHNLHTTNMQWDGCSTLAYDDFDPVQMISFDGHVFFRGINKLVANPNHPDVGPFSPSGFAGTICPDGLRQVELYRYNPASQETVVFDLYSVSVDQTEEFSQANRYVRFGSSDPRYFAVANGTLYFQASRTDGVISDQRTDSELYRMTAADGPPEILRLNPNGPSQARPVGEFLGRLWLTADTGTGIDLHHFAADNMTAVPLGIGTSIASTARGFTVLEDRLVFSARDDDGRWGTYTASIDDPTPEDPQNPKKPKDPKRPDNPKSPNGPVSQPKPTTGGLKSTLLINGDRNVENSVLIKPTGTRLSVSCELTNQSSRAMQSVRIVLTEQKRGRAARTSKQRLGQCQRNSVRPGGTVSCQRKTTLRGGTRRLQCTTIAKTATGRRLVAHDAALVRGRSSR